MTVLITGATSGIGLATARRFSAAGAKVLVVGRTKASGDGAAEAISRETGRDVHAYAVDLSVQAEVRALAAAVAQDHPRLDLLVNDAGVQPWTRQATPDGLELTWATNVMAPFLLSQLLLPALAPGGQIVNVSSVVHRWGRLAWDDLQATRGYDPNAVYYQSKLALTVLTLEAARRFAPQGVRCNALEPGMTRTAFADGFRGFYCVMARLSRPFLRTPDAVAAEILDLATNPAFTALTGAYLRRGQVGAVVPEAADPATGARLWDRCTSLADGAPTWTVEPR